jgi:phosphoribosylformylglycinamidine cyclo-ligase
MMHQPRTYAQAGVDIQDEDKAVRNLIRQIKHQREGIGAPLTEIGHYSGLIDMGDYALAITTDGVGTKILIANHMRRWDTIGIDCIAMNVNDLITIGAEPLAFVDYLAMDKPDENIAAEIGVGLDEGARLANISIVGGETATIPDIVRGLDLAGTCVGMVPKDRIITGENIDIGDAIVGLPSSGIHSNGLTLARKIVDTSSYTYFDYCPFDSSRTIGNDLLTPTRIYSEVLSVLDRYMVHGMAHITGSGLLNLRRLTDLGFDIRTPLEPQPIFKFLQEIGGVSTEEMYRTFNMGMGFMIVTPMEHAHGMAEMLDGQVVGEIVDSAITVQNMLIE